MHVGSFWGMNFSGMFLPLSLGKWHHRGLQMELPSFRGYFVQTGQLDWTVHEKKKKKKKGLTTSLQSMAPQGVGKFASKKIHWQIVIIWPPPVI